MYFKPDARISDADYLKTYNIFRLGDIAFEGNKSKSYSYGRFVENTIGDGIVSHVFVVFRPTSTDHNLDYWKYAINNENVMGRILSKCTKKTTMMTNLVTDDFLGQTALVPCAAEQKKIADFLNLIDERITKQQCYVEFLKKYKRGLLSGVFSETANNIEYDTTAYSFREIASRRKEKYNPASGICFPCVELEHLEQETGRILGSVPSDQQNSIKTVCKVGDTMFGKLRPYLRKYAYANNDLVCSSEIWSLVPSDIVVPKYLFYLVQTEQFIRAANISSGTKMPRAEWTSVEKSVFNIPSKNTQEKIVSLFEGIDKKLDNAQTTLIMLEDYKLGLLQQLFI